MPNINVHIPMAITVAVVAAEMVSFLWFYLAGQDRFKTTELLANIAISYLLYYTKRDGHWPAQATWCKGNPVKALSTVVWIAVLCSLFDASDAFLVTVNRTDFAAIGRFMIFAGHKFLILVTITGTIDLVGEYKKRRCGTTKSNLRTTSSDDKKQQ